MIEGSLEQLSTYRCVEDAFPRAYLKRLLLGPQLPSVSHFCRNTSCLALHRTEPVGTHGPLTKHHYYKDLVGGKQKRTFGPWKVERVVRETTT